ncbi:hypothetical protein [Chryseobacterium sp. MYb328]|uniref:hypothetical protein n=1 Tax=Chryseobacterium sp. MYb328 TaxID=2745231 RepID=UPI0030A28043
MKIALKGSLGDIGKALLGILSPGVQLVMIVSGNKNEAVGSLKNSGMIKVCCWGKHYIMGRL